MILENFLGRARDRKITRPAGLVFSMDDKPPLATAAGLAFQHLAIQSIIFVLPAVTAGMLSRDPADATRFLCLSILAAAIWQGLQVLRRGPIGSGYPLPATHSAAPLGAYAVIAAEGGGFGAAGASLMITGVALVLLTFVMRRTRVFLPNEIAGVVVILIGVALVTLSAQRMGLTNPGGMPDPIALACAAVSIAIMAAVALTHSRLTPFAVLAGSVVGIALAELLGRGVPDAARILAARPWLAFPEPWLPRFDEVSFSALSALLVTIVALKATALGSMVVMQRGADASWTLPDPRPLRRGLLANGIAVILAGLIGGACPGPAAAAVGLSVATGTLARRIVWVGTGLMVVLALCPKVVALFILVPYAVQGAMLFYLAGFIMAQGAQLVTARLLDPRRTLIVAMGLSAGLLAGLAPAAFQTWAPAIASPISFGALVAFVVNLITLPLVKRRSTLTLPLDEAAGTAVIEWFSGLGGSWGLKAQTVQAGDAALTEFVYILAARGLATCELTAMREEDHVRLRLGWSGPPLPKPTARPHYKDMLGTEDAMEGFAVWMATRHAHGFTQRALPDGTEAVLTLDD